VLDAAYLLGRRAQTFSVGAVDIFYFSATLSKFREVVIAKDGIEPRHEIGARLERIYF
jgi:hypothetical protein